MTSTDCAFAAWMLVHHEQGMELAELVRDRAQQGELRRFAETMMARLQGEIAALQGWLHIWRAWPPPQQALPHAPGGISAGQVRWLTGLYDQRFDLGVVQTLLVHQHSALEVVNAVQSEGALGAASHLAERIADGARQDIDQLARWQSSWRVEVVG